jgi:hypothetical protein
LYWSIAFTGEHLLRVFSCPGAVQRRSWRAFSRIRGRSGRRRRKLSDRQDHVDEIAALFDAMVPAAELGSPRQSIEFYRSSRELVLLQPVR